MARYGRGVTWNRKTGSNPIKENLYLKRFEVLNKLKENPRYSRELPNNNKTSDFMLKSSFWTIKHDWEGLKGF